MTLWVTRQNEHPDAPLVVSATSGSVEVKVAEEIGHLRYFWHDLGQALDAAERRLHMADHEDRLRHLERAARQLEEARKPQSMTLAEESNGAD